MKQNNTQKQAVTRVSSTYQPVGLGFGVMDSSLPCPLYLTHAISDDAPVVGGGRQPRPGLQRGRVLLGSLVKPHLAVQQQTELVVEPGPPRRRLTGGCRQLMTAFALQGTQLGGAH